MTKKLLLMLAAAMVAAPAMSAPRTARCVVDTIGNATWQGPSRFEAERGGSFTISPVRGTFAGGITQIGVAIGQPGIAEVRGLTSRGINSRWGIAGRSERDRACWVGEDFRVCVY